MTCAQSAPAGDRGGRGTHRRARIVAALNLEHVDAVALERRGLARKLEAQAQAARGGRHEILLRRVHGRGRGRGRGVVAREREPARDGAVRVARDADAARARRRGQRGGRGAADGVEVEAVRDAALVRAVERVEGRVDGEAARERGRRRGRGGVRERDGARGGEGRVGVARGEVEAHAEDDAAVERGEGGRGVAGVEVLGVEGLAGGQRGAGAGTARGRTRAWVSAAPKARRSPKDARTFWRAAASRTPAGPAGEVEM